MMGEDTTQVSKPLGPSLLNNQRPIQQIQASAVAPIMHKGPGAAQVSKQKADPWGNLEDDLESQTKASNPKQNN